MIADGSMMFLGNSIQLAAAIKVVMPDKVSAIDYRFSGG